MQLGIPICPISKNKQLVDSQIAVNYFQAGEVDMSPLIRLYLACYTGDRQAIKAGSPDHRCAHNTKHTFKKRKKYNFRKVLRSRSRWSQNYFRSGAGAEIILDLEPEPKLSF